MNAVLKTVTTTRLGRPPLREGVVRESKSVAMDPADVRFALELGGGQLSAGIAKAIEMAKQMMENPS